MRSREAPPTSVEPHTPVTLEVRGSLSPAEGDCAIGMIGAVLAHHDVPASGTRLRVTTASCGGPALVQVNLRVFGAPARIQIAGRGVADAIAAASTRLAAQIRRLTRQWEPWPWPDPSRPVLALPTEGRISRHKAFRLAVRAPCAAIAFMNAMDYDVHLFTDAETGQDAIVYRAGPTGFRLARQLSMHPPAGPTGFPLTLNVHRVPVLGPQQAVARLAEIGLPFLFFTDHATGRGNVLYRRYDAQLGLISPAHEGVIGDD